MHFQREMINFFFKNKAKMLNILPSATLYWLHPKDIIDLITNYNSKFITFTQQKIPYFNQLYINNLIFIYRKNYLYKKIN